jgi:hypothetical protein
MIRPGNNTMSCIQLAPMSCAFAIHASVVNPPPDMSHFSQFVEKFAVQGSQDIQAVSAHVTTLPKIS